MCKQTRDTCVEITEKWCPLVNIAGLMSFVEEIESRRGYRFGGMFESVFLGNVHDFPVYSNYFQRDMLMTLCQYSIKYNFLCTRCTILYLTARVARMQIIILRESFSKHIRHNVHLYFFLRVSTRGDPGFSVF